jgi:uncharacterized protein YbjT (DUF2867 family)
MRVFVTGATGKQGGAVTAELKAAGHDVVAMTRKPEGDAARGLQAKGVRVVRGSFEDPASIEAGMRGADAAFLMGTPFEAGPEAEFEQGRTGIAAARRAGVPWVVYTSVSDANRKTLIPHFDSKFQVEEELRVSGLDFAIIAPVFFMENLLSPWMAPGIKDGTLAMALPSDRRLQMIGVREIGRFAAAVLQDRKRFSGKRIDVASDEPTMAETAAALSAWLGRPVKHVEVPIDAIRRQSEDQARMFEFFRDRGYSADIAALKKDFPAVGWRSLGAWLKDQPRP